LSFSALSTTVTIVLGRKKKRIGQKTIDEPATVLEIRRIHFEEAIEFFRRLEFRRDDIPK
jgi:hypothetical protein